MYPSRRKRPAGVDANVDTDGGWALMRVLLGWIQTKKGLMPMLSPGEARRRLSLDDDGDVNPAGVDVTQARCAPPPLPTWRGAFCASASLPSSRTAARWRLESKR
eukprot:4903582-Pyramimonas_sp.AAC.1